MLVENVGWIQPFVYHIFVLVKMVLSGTVWSPSYSMSTQKRPKQIIAEELLPLAPSLSLYTHTQIHMHTHSTFKWEEQRSYYTA